MMPRAMPGENSCKRAIRAGRGISLKSCPRYSKGPGKRGLSVCCREIALTNFCRTFACEDGGGTRLGKSTLAQAIL